jgi:glycine cleavage system H protein
MEGGPDFMHPEYLKYTQEHEWIREDGDVYVVGITDYAADQLGDVTYVELPEVGLEVSANEEVAAVESVKAASDVFAPVAGTIDEVNTDLEEKPQLVNENPYGDGWFFKLRDIEVSDLDNLMDAAEYEKFLKDM